VDDTLYLHGAATNRSLAAALDGVCITVTHVDGLVLARSASGHSMNFRSVVVRGHARAVTDPEERRAALVAVVEHGIPGRWAEVRPPSAKEIESTTVVAVDLAECSDRGLRVWAGEIPLRLVAGAPRPDPHLSEGIDEPASVTEVLRRFPGPAPAGA
jgi:hypothetical protein